MGKPCPWSMFEDAVACSANQSCRTVSLSWTFRTEAFGTQFGCSTPFEHTETKHVLWLGITWSIQWLGNGRGYATLPTWSSLAWMFLVCKTPDCMWLSTAGCNSIIACSGSCNLLQRWTSVSTNDETGSGLWNRLWHWRSLSASDETISSG